VPAVMVVVMVLVIAVMWAVEVIVIAGLAIGCRSRGPAVCVVVGVGRIVRRARRVRVFVCVPDAVMGVAVGVGDARHRRGD
jgi:hypothetical protein